MEEPERITLTQRRKEMTGASKLERSKLESISNEPDDEQSGAAKRIVVWVVIILAISVAGYLGLRAFIDSRQDDDTETTTDLTPTPTPTLEEQIVSSAILGDALAPSVQEESKYSVLTQSVGVQNADMFTLEKLYVQPYETFSRVEFTLMNEGTTMYPYTKVTYDAALKTLTVDLSNISEDKSLLEYDQSIDVQNSVITKITHATVVGQNESYVFDLSTEKKFVLHVIEDTDSTRVVLDIKEIDRTEVTEITPEPTSEVSTTNVVNPTVAVSPTSASQNTSSDATEFSTSAQSLTTSTTGNVVTITGFSFNDAPTAFTYKYKLSGGYPNVSATLQNKVLTLTIKNLALDKIVGNGGSGSRDFAAAGVRDVNTLNVSNSNYVSTYVFQLDRDAQYRLVFDKTESVLKLEIKH